MEAVAAFRAMASDPGLGLIHEAEAAFDEGIAIEDRLLRGWLRKHKAAWLAERDRRNEAVAIYEWLLRQPWQNSWEIQRCQANIATLKG